MTIRQVCSQGALGLIFLFRWHPQLKSVLDGLGQCLSNVPQNLFFAAQVKAESPPVLAVNPRLECCEIVETPSCVSGRTHTLHVSLRIYLRVSVC